MVLISEQLRQDIADAGGSLEDQLWIRQVYRYLSGAQVGAKPAQRICQEPIQAMQASNTPATRPAETPEQWADKKIKEAVQEREDIFEYSATRLTTLFTYFCYTAAIFYLFLAVLIFWKPDSIYAHSAPAALIIPLYLAVQVQVATYLQERVLAFASYRVSGLLTAAYLALFIVFPGGLLLFDSAVYGFFAGEATDFSSWGLAAVLFLSLGVFVRWLVSLRPYNLAKLGSSKQVSDRRWIDDFRIFNSSKHRLSKKAIDAHLADTTAYAQKHGGGLYENFGNPVSYACSLPQDPRVKAGRELFYSLFCGACLFFAISYLYLQGQLSWLYVGLFVLVCAQATSALRKYRDAHKQGQEDINK